MNLYSVRIRGNSHEKLLMLEKFNLDLQYRVAKKTDEDYYEVSGILTDNQIDKIKQAGYHIEVIDDLDTIAKERRKEISSSNRFTTSTLLSEAADIRA